MSNVALDIGSRLTKVYFSGDVPSKRVFETPKGVQKLKERFNLGTSVEELDSFLRVLCCASRLMGTQKNVELLVSADENPIFSQYVLRWLSSITFRGSCSIVDQHSWMLNLYGALENGCVVDIGNQATRVVPVMYSTPVVEAITIGSGMQDLFLQAAEEAVDLHETLSNSTYLKLHIPLPMVADWIMMLIEESLVLCNPYTQRSFVSNVFLITGGGVAAAWLVKALRSNIIKNWPSSRVLFVSDSAPMLWMAGRDS
ncbi:uncharacterized protein TM35_000212870 [Trypanosoma theileri]|uniref:Actin-like protein n=1 Tax=Trypanosoma theileri TaxID=67003 RepID=A0A1X0NSV5_9TRYP|nr:uncharacterized protein TM35_000212870 [Trypanosoma theileri]ORC87681.1 hypothetical protein TM35_000212870 [Trypanosoma theileri]